MMKGTLLGVALALGSLLMLPAGAASASPPGPCVEGDYLQISTGMYGYIAYGCSANEWFYLYTCNESGYCYI